MENNEKNLSQIVNSIIEVTHRISLLLIIIIGLISPGYLFIFIFFGKEFMSIPTTKLIILAIALAFPAFLINSLTAYIILKKKRAQKYIEENGIKSIYPFLLATAGALLAIIFFLPLLLYYFRLISTARQLVLVFGITQIIAIIILAFFFRKK